MPLGQDQQYDENWKEQDKMRRRQELRNRLKMEAIDKKYNPIRQMKGILFTDPSVDRYTELRKYGRMPGAPLKPSIFFTLLGSIMIPIIGLKYIIDWERKDYLIQMANGDISYEDRPYKHVI